jgi:CRP-like cAMP-binding protein
MVHVEQLVRISFFQGLPASTLWPLAEAASEVDMRRGDHTVHQHDQAQHVFFLGAGAVQIFIRFLADQSIRGLLSNEWINKHPEEAEMLGNLMHPSLTAACSSPLRD